MVAEHYRSSRSLIFVVTPDLADATQRALAELGYQDSERISYPPTYLGANPGYAALVHATLKSDRPEAEFNEVAIRVRDEVQQQMNIDLREDFFQYVM